MLEIRKTAVAFDENDLIELEEIVIDNDAEQALKFLKKSVYERIVHSQQGRLKSHLDGTGSPVEKFRRDTGNR